MENEFRLGLVCIFRKEPIKFRRTTAKYLKKLTKNERLKKLSDICWKNAISLQKALEFCSNNAIGDFRVNSQILPLKTHPEVGYDIQTLCNGADIVAKFEECGDYAKRQGLRVTFHPDQFVVLSSNNPKVRNNSIKEIDYQAEVSEWINADVINIHGGGRYDSKSKALKRLSHSFERLSSAAKERLTIENDDYIYSPLDLIPVCKKLRIPFVYDVHHHRCLTDKMSIEEATVAAIDTWNREPLFHISSPKNGWNHLNCRPHHDYINIEDFPSCWKDKKLTIEVEAKSKELAVLKLKKDLKNK